MIIIQMLYNNVVVVDDIEVGIADIHRIVDGIQKENRKIVLYEYDETGTI